MCIDYRGLDAITVKNAKPLPRIDDLLDKGSGVLAAIAGLQGAAARGDGGLQEEAHVWVDKGDEGSRDRGGCGDGGYDGDDDKKGKGCRKDDGKKEGDKSEGGERREKMKVKVPWTYTRKREESIFHLKAAMDTYLYSQLIPYWDRVLMASSCLGGDAASFAISLVKEDGCTLMVQYLQRTRIKDFFKALKNRFKDKNLARHAEHLISNRKWKSARTLKATMDELMQCSRPPRSDS
ncbi:hypothetical protein CBR_g66739 [Chara braunii]|uniref:Uncharacterized protein n=1 Tax=Chara braunii TaxID=69332 RepID=A0A388JQ89_CHABU|nr:hypothetical protein CBR_g66739 [Chara braunii]|eukprot:GBG59933.1 hypothetical protein CBR_g66739 [Chara braunii]